MADKGKLGLWMLTALVAGNMIGSGIFLLPAALASFGTISLFSWGFTAIGAISLALVFAKLSSIVPKTGGPYAYCREGFGDFVGFQIAYNYWIALWVGNAAIVVALVSYLSVFWPALKDNLALAFIVKVAIVWLLTLINCMGIRRAGILQIITTVLKLLPLIVVTVFGVFFIKPEYFSHFNISGESNFSAISHAATLTLWAFIGLESATVPAESAMNPSDISRATLLGTIITAVIYMLSTAVLMGLIPAPVLMHSTAPYADAANILFGSQGGMLIAAGAVISCFGALNGWILLQGQVPLAAARDKLFPAPFAKLSANETPVFGLVISSLLITLLLALTLAQSLVKQFTFIILLATLSQLIPYFFTTMAELAIFVKRKGNVNQKQLLKSVLIAIFAGIYAFWAIMGSGADTVFYGTLLFFSSVPVYVWMEWNKSKKVV